MLSFQEARQQEAAKKSITPNDGRVRPNWLPNLGRSSRSARSSQGVGKQERDGYHKRSGKGRHKSGGGSCMSPARDSRVVLRRQAEKAPRADRFHWTCLAPLSRRLFFPGRNLKAPHRPVERVRIGRRKARDGITGSSQFSPGHHSRRGSR